MHETGIPTTDKSADKVLRMQAAITAIKFSKKDFSYAELVPIHLLISTAELAVGGRDINVTVYLEYKLLDSVGNEVMVRVVRKGDADILSNGDEKLTIKNVQALLKNWEIDLRKNLFSLKEYFNIVKEN